MHYFMMQAQIHLLMLLVILKVEPLIMNMKQGPTKIEMELSQRLLLTYYLEILILRKLEHKAQDKLQVLQHLEEMVNF